MSDISFHEYSRDLMEALDELVETGDAILRSLFR